MQWQSEAETSKTITRLYTIKCSTYHTNVDETTPSRRSRVFDQTIQILLHIC